MFCLKKYYTLGQLLGIMQDGQIAKAEFAESEEWYIKQMYGMIYYSDENGSTGDLVPLTYSNINAYYHII